MSPLEVFTQQVINGFTTGSYLALIALGYTMVYGLIELINFAHGDIYALGFFVSLTLFTWLGVPHTLVVALPTGTLVWMLPMVMLLTMLGTGLANMSLDRLAYKPLRRAPRIAALITAVGASFALENLMQNWYGPSQILYPNQQLRPRDPRVGSRAEGLHCGTGRGTADSIDAGVAAGCGREPAARNWDVGSYSPVISHHVIGLNRSDLSAHSKAAHGVDAVVVSKRPC